MTFTRKQWAADLLTALQMPKTPQNVEALVAWSLQEGGHCENAALYNPLNTARKDVKGSWVAIGVDGIRGYPTYEAGIEGTVKTLHNGLYGGILSALQKGDNSQAVLTAAANSKWAASRYRGVNWLGIRATARQQIATSASC